MRRNDIVINITEGWMVYGRVVSVRGDKARVIDCGRYDRWIPVKDLEVRNWYKGFWERGFTATGDPNHPFPRFRRMPTLRRLKQARACYDKTVWKRNSPRPKLIDRRRYEKELAKVEEMWKLFGWK